MFYQRFMYIYGVMTMVSGGLVGYAFATNDINVMFVSTLYGTFAYMKMLSELNEWAEEHKGE